MIETLIRNVILMDKIVFGGQGEWITKQICLRSEVRLSDVLVEQVKLAVRNFLCAMGGAFQQGGVRGIPPANGGVAFCSPLTIGVSEIIVRIWEAGWSADAFYLLCAV